jgi:hypothetical protein
MWESSDPKRPNAWQSSASFFVQPHPVPHMRPQVYFCGYPACTLAISGLSQRFGLWHCLPDRSRKEAWIFYSKPGHTLGVAGHLPCGEGSEQLWDPCAGCSSFSLRVVLLTILDTGDTVNIPYQTVWSG